MFSFLTKVWRSINGLLKKALSIFCPPQPPKHSEEEASLLPIQIAAASNSKTSPQIPPNDSVSVAVDEADEDEEIVYVAKPYVSVQHEPVAVPHQNFPFADEEEEEEEEEEEVKKAVAVDEGCRRIKHYNSTHRILLVGEGDFSFSACLAKAFGTASKMVATSLNSQEFLHKNYANAASNIAELTTRNCVVLHGVDATQMHQHKFLRHIPFDRVIFNFPYAGLFGQDMPREKQLLRHRRLVSLFLKNAKEMIGLDGEIHVTHKTCWLQKDWKLESIASSHGLKLIKAVKFRQRDYPGYHTKYGFGGDKDFDCNPSKTYMFGFK